MAEEEAVPEETFHDCPSCGAKVSNTRSELLGTELCIRCTPQIQKPLGVMEYGHKTAGVLVLAHTREQFLELKKPANRRR